VTLSIGWTPRSTRTRCHSSRLLVHRFVAVRARLGPLMAHSGLFERTRRTSALQADLLATQIMGALDTRNVRSGLTALWVRKRLSGGLAEVHCHMLFHLAHPFIRGRRRVEVERTLERLIDRHGEGNYLDCTLKLTFPANPNGGGGPDVWRKFGVPSCWRKQQDLIHGKRCGVTENIALAARRRWKEQHRGAGREAA